MSAVEAIVPHRRQYVVGPAPYHEFEDWSHLQLAAATWLSHCPALRVCTATRENSGELWALLGLAVATREDEPDPVAAIAGSSMPPGPDLYDSWAGRWALVGPGQLHLDATGLLGCYYGSAADGGFWASSSPALLTPILFGDTPPPADPRKLKWARGVSWVVPPRSRLAGMDRLLPSQILELSEARVAPRRLLPEIDAGLDGESVSGMLVQSLVTALTRLGPIEQQPWLGLSAGADSRLLLAAAHSGGVELRTFTRVAGRMSLADYLLPPLLAGEVGYSHSYLEAGRPISGRRDQVAHHTADHVSQGDAEPFVLGVRDSLQGVSIGGQGFGVGKKFVHAYAPERLANTERTASALARGLGEPPGSSAESGLRDWLDWVEQTDLPYLDWRDRWYLEQRMAGWQSAKEQVYDMGRHERFFPINAARSYALLLSLARQHAPGVAHQVEMIRTLEPRLLRHPINPPDHSFGRLRAGYIKTRQDPRYLLRRGAEACRRLLGGLRARVRRTPQTPGSDVRD